MTRFSLSLMTRLLRSGPAMTRSMASSMAAIPMVAAPRLAVEATGPEQRGVEDVGPVGGGDEDDAGACVEAVHLDEELVERLLPLVVAAAHAGAAVAADGVDLV